MNIARKTLILFIVLTVCFYFLTLGLLGKGGYMYNRSLKRILENLEYTSDLLKSDIESLKIRSDSLNTEEGIRDAALSLGYYVEGDTIYLFSTSEVQDPVPSVELEKEELHPFSAFSNLAKTFTGPSAPRFVVTRMTPLAPRAPYNAVAVASFMTEKLAMSSGWRRARSVAVNSILSMRMRGVVFPSKVATPRMKKSVLSCKINFQICADVK